MSGERGGHHPAFPRTPAERLDHAAGAPLRLVGGDLVQDLVGHRVVALAGIAVARRYRREERDETQRILRGGREERAQAGDLGVEDAIELLLRLLADVLVGEDAGAVDEAGDRAPLGADRGQRG